MPVASYSYKCSLVTILAVAWSWYSRASVCYIQPLARDISHKFSSDLTKIRSRDNKSHAGSKLKYRRSERPRSSACAGVAAWHALLCSVSPLSSRLSIEKTRPRCTYADGRTTSFRDSYSSMNPWVFEISALSVSLKGFRSSITLFVHWYQEPLCFSSGRSQTTRCLSGHV
jgi:hypothetical protein